MSTSSGTASTMSGDPADRFVGLSIGDREVQLVLLDDRRRVVDACAIDTPPSSVIDGTIVDPARLTTLLGIVGAELGLTGARAVVALRPSGSSFDREPGAAVRAAGSTAVERDDFGPVEPAQQRVAVRIAEAAGMSVLRVEHALVAAVRGLAPSATATGLLLLPTPAPGLALVTAGGELVTGTVWRATGTEPHFWPMERSMTDLLLRGGLEQRIALLTRIIRRQQPDPVPLRRGGDGLAADSPSPLPTFAAALGAAVGAHEASVEDAATPRSAARPTAAASSVRTVEPGDQLADAGDGSPATCVVASDALVAQADDQRTLEPAPLTASPTRAPTTTSTPTVAVAATVAEDPATGAATERPSGPVHPLFVHREQAPEPVPTVQATTPAWTPVDPERAVQRRRAAAGGIVAVALAAGLLGASRLRDDGPSVRVDSVDTTSVSGVPTPRSTMVASVGAGPTATLLNAPAGTAAPITLPPDPAGAIAPSVTAPATAPTTTAPPTPTTAPSPTPPPTAPATTTTAFDPNRYPAREVDGIPVNSAQVLTLADRTDADLDDAASALAEILAAHPQWTVRLLADGNTATGGVATDLARRIAVQGIDAGRIRVEPTGAAAGTLTVWIVAPDA